MCYRWTMELISLKKGIKKQSALTENISIKTKKKRFFNSICTPPEHPDSPQNLYLWAFSQFSPLLKLLGGEIYLAVSWYIFVCFIIHIHLILHFCVPRLNFLEPKWSHFLTHNCIYRNWSGIGCSTWISRCLS